MARFLQIFFLLFQLWLCSSFISVAEAGRVVSLYPPYSNQLALGQLFPKGFPDSEEARVQFQNQFKVHFEQGLVLDIKGAPLDSSSVGTLNYILDKNGNLYIADPKQPNTASHAYLALGEPVLAAGEIRLAQGKVTYLSNKSGHYFPTTVQLKQIEDEILKNQCFANHYEIDLYDLKTIQKEKPKEEASSASPYRRGFALLPSANDLDPFFRMANQLNPHAYALSLEKLLSCEPIHSSVRTLSHKKWNACFADLSAKTEEINAQISNLKRISSILEEGRLAHPIFEVLEENKEQLKVDERSIFYQDYIKKFKNENHRIQKKDGQYLLLPKEHRSALALEFETKKKNLERKVKSDLTVLQQIHEEYLKELSLRKLEMLPGIEKIHLIWIGSPLSSEQVTRIQDLCKKLESRSSSEIKMVIWMDENLLKGEPLLNEPLASECDGRISIQDISQIFLSSREGGKCSKTLPFSLSLSEAQSSDLYQQVEKTYRYLKSQASPKLKPYAAMVDLLKALVVYRYGGIYFDINKDFKSLAFLLPDGTRLNEVDQKKIQDNLIVGVWTNLQMKETGALLGRKENVTLRKRFFMEDFGLRESSEKIVGKDRHITEFVNTDFMGSVRPKHPVLRTFLEDAVKSYREVQKEPFLQLFMNPNYFSSITWVFSLGGPCAFTASLMKNPDAVFSMKQTATYQGSKSWNVKQGAQIALILLKNYLEKAAHSEPSLRPILDRCWTHNQVANGLDARYHEDIQNCFFNSMRSLLRSQQISESVHQNLNQFAQRFSSSIDKFTFQIHEKCSKRQIFLDRTLENVSCKDKNSIQKEIKFPVSSFDWPKILE